MIPLEMDNFYFYQGRESIIETHLTENTLFKSFLTG